MAFRPKLIVILGPTASGKSALAVKLAKKFKGEIVSADSRQVYKGLDIGSGKITKPEMLSIPHHLIDVASPKRKFTVAQFQKTADKKILEIRRRGHVPLLVGGTGFYLQAVVDGIAIPPVKPDWKLHKELEKKSLTQLVALLERLDPERARSIDRKNPRRLIRAIEVTQATNQPIKKLMTSQPYEALEIGIAKPLDELKKHIAARLQKRLKQGMVAEVKKLRRRGLSWKRLEELGLEYRYVAQFLQGKITFEEMKRTIQKESERFAKRQMTWFKRNKRIHWISSQKEATALIKKHLVR